MKIDLPMPPEKSAPMADIEAYLNRMRETIIYVADLMGKIPPGGDYEGPYAFTPSRATQIIAIANKAASENITINPIPSNYGLVTWNGSTLTIT